MCKTKRICLDVLKIFRKKYRLALEIAKKVHNACIHDVPNKQKAIWQLIKNNTSNKNWATIYINSVLVNILQTLLKT